MSNLFDELEGISNAILQDPANGVETSGKERNPEKEDNLITSQVMSLNKKKRLRASAAAFIPRNDARAIESMEAQQIDSDLRETTEQDDNWPDEKLRDLSIADPNLRSLPSLARQFLKVPHRLLARLLVRCKGDAHTAVLMLKCIGEIESYDIQASGDSAFTLKTEDFPSFTVARGGSEDILSDWRIDRRLAAAKTVPTDEEKLRMQREAHRASCMEAREDEIESVPIDGSDPFSVAWSTTGDTVEALYGRWRSEAAAKAQLRNELFERATQAYFMGDKAAAKRLGQQGRQLQAEMKALHEAAAANIFEYRNRYGVDGEPLPGREGRLFDLHGLHADEGIAIIEKALATHRSSELHFVTGTGHHSAGSAVLRPGIISYLKRRGLRFYEPEWGRIVLQGTK